MVNSEIFESAFENDFIKEDSDYFVYKTQIKNNGLTFNIFKDFINVLEHLYPKFQQLGLFIIRETVKLETYEQILEKFKNILFIMVDM